jgi:hypothetical protein
VLPRSTVVVKPVFMYCGVVSESAGLRPTMVRSRIELVIKNLCRTKEN